MSAINLRPLVAAVTGQEKMPTGEVGDLTISPAQIAGYTQDLFECGEWVVQTTTPNPLTATAGCAINDGVLVVTDRPALEGDENGYFAVAKGPINDFPLTVQIDVPTIVGNFFMIGITESGIDVRDQLAQLQTDGMAPDTILYVANVGGGFYQTMLMTEDATDSLDPTAIASGVLKITISSDYVLSIEGHSATYTITQASAQALSLASYGQTRDVIGNLPFLAGVSSVPIAPIGAKDGFIYRVTAGGVFAGKLLAIGCYVIFFNNLSDVIVIDSNQDVIEQLLAVVDAMVTAQSAEAATRASADTTEKNARIAADTSEANARTAAINGIKSFVYLNVGRATLITEVSNFPTPETFADGLYLLNKDLTVGGIDYQGSTSPYFFVKVGTSVTEVTISDRISLDLYSPVADGNYYLGRYRFSYASGGGRYKEAQSCRVLEGTVGSPDMTTNGGNHYVHMSDAFNNYIVNLNDAGVFGLVYSFNLDPYTRISKTVRASIVANVTATLDIDIGQMVESPAAETAIFGSGLSIAGGKINLAVTAGDRIDLVYTRQFIDENDVFAPIQMLKCEKSSGVLPAAT